MPNFENEVKEFISEMNYETQQKAVFAIQDAFNQGRDWEWVLTALNKKSISNWEKRGFGLFFNKNFIGAVYEQMERETACKDIDVEDFFNNLKEDARWF